MDQGRKKLFVSNINYDATNEDLFKLFSEVGKVKSARVIFERETGRSRGFGFVEMFNDKDSERALAMDGEKFFGRDLNVSYAVEKVR